MGAMSIMMMSSTSMTSTSGVTLMSALRDPLDPRSMAMAEFPYLEIWNLEIWKSEISKFADFQIAKFLRGFLDEIVDQLRRGVVHFDVEVLDPAGQVVVEPHRRDRDDQPERGLDQRFRDADRHRADAGRAAGADALERVDEPDHGPPQAT